MSKNFMQIAIGLFFLVVSGCFIYSTLLYKEQVDRQTQFLSISTSALNNWKEISYALIARGFESAELMSPTETNKIVGEVIEYLSVEDERLGTFATAVNDSYLNSLNGNRELKEAAAENSCQYAFDNECDEPDLCPIGTDTADC
jgi:hypothetical protein